MLLNLLEQQRSVQYARSEDKSISKDTFGKRSVFVSCPIVSSKHKEGGVSFGSQRSEIQFIMAEEFW